MTVLPDNELPLLLSQYRKLAAQKKGIDTEMAQVKANIEPIVEAQGGKYVDDEGYARIVTRNPSVSYPNQAVDDLAQVWAKSENPDVKTCGEGLLRHRQERGGYQYLQVK